MTTIAQVRDAMAAAVATIDGLRAYAYELDTINAPAAHVVSLEYDPRYVMADAPTEYQFQIRVYVPRAAVEQAQKLLDGYREVSGATSIRAAVQNENNRPAGLADYFSVTRIGAVGVVEVAGAPYLYLEIDVEAVF